MYSSTEREAFQLLFDDIRDKVFTSPCVTTMMEFTKKLVTIFNSLGVDCVREHTKNTCAENWKLSLVTV